TQIEHGRFDQNKRLVPRERHPVSIENEKRRFCVRYLRNSPVRGLTESVQFKSADCSIRLQKENPVSFGKNRQAHPLPVLDRKKSRDLTSIRIDRRSRAGIHQ